MSKRSGAPKIPLKSKDLPATQGMLSLTRDELKSDIRALDSKMEVRFGEVHTVIGGVHAEVGKVRSELRAELRSEIGSVRTELRTEIGSVHSKIDGLGTELRAEITNVHSKIDGLGAELRAEFRAEIGGLKTDVHRVYQAVHQVASEVARIGVLVEEQNSRNQVVLEGMVGLMQRQDRVEVRMDEVEKTVHTLARSRV